MGFVGRVFLDKGLKFIFFNISPFGGLGFLFFLVPGSLCTSERNIYHRFTSSLCHGALFVSGSFICAQRKVRAGQNYFELGSPSRGFQSLRLYVVRTLVDFVIFFFYERTLKIMVVFIFTLRVKICARNENKFYQSIIPYKAADLRRN